MFVSIRTRNHVVDLKVTLTVVRYMQQRRVLIKHKHTTKHMSNAIAQSATTLAKSGQGEDNFDLVACVAKVALRAAKGTTRERQMINRNKLVSATCSDYRSHFASVYGKSEKLPADIFAKINDAVDTFIKGTLAQVNPANAIMYRRGFHHNGNQYEVTERVQVVGENKLTLKEQHLGINLFIGAAEKRLKALEAKKTPDYDMEKQVKEQLMKLNVTKSYIQTEMQRQNVVIEEVKASEATAKTAS